MDLILHVLDLSEMANLPHPLLPGPCDHSPLTGHCPLSSLSLGPMPPEDTKCVQHLAQGLYMAGAQRTCSALMEAWTDGHDTPTTPPSS